MVGNFYFGWLFYNLICGTLLLNFSRKTKLCQNRLILGIFCLSCFVLAIFGNSITPDYMPYRDIISEIAQTKDPFTHLEDIYVKLIHNIGDDYFLYQCIIYGIEFILFFFLLSKSIIKSKYIICFMALFAILGLYNAIGGRAGLCYVTTLYGIFCLYNRQKILGILFLILGILLHKFGIILSPLFIIASIIPISFNRKRLIFFLIIVLVAIVVMRYVINNSFGDLLDQMSDINAAGANYLAKEESPNEGGSFWWKLIGLYKTLFFMLISFRVLYLANRFINDNKIIGLFYRISILLITLAIIYYSLGLPDPTIGGRFLSAATIPICIIVALISEYKPYKHHEKNICILGLLVYLLFNNAFIVGVSHINGV